MKYCPALDGIRAVAVCVVILFHARNDWLPGGWAGVDIFFVLSGYLITRLLLDELRASNDLDLKSFYLRRTLRLTPALVALLAAELAVANFTGKMGETLPAVIASATYMMNWYAAFGWGPKASLGHTWSLGVEEQFYLLWPILLSFHWRRRLLTKIVFIIVLITVWRWGLHFGGAPFWRTSVGFDTHADSLMIGCALAATNLSDRLKRAAKAFVPAPIVGLTLIFALMGNDTHMSQTIGFPMASLFTAWILVAAQQEGWLSRALSWKGMVHTGRMSYGLYLWHRPFLVVGLLHFPGCPQYLLVAASYVVAAASYRWVETPFLRLKRRLQPRGLAVSGEAPVGA